MYKYAVHHLKAKLEQGLLHFALRHSVAYGLLRIKNGLLGKHSYLPLFIFQLLNPLLERVNLLQFCIFFSYFEDRLGKLHMFHVRQSQSFFALGVAAGAGVDQSLHVVVAVMHHSELVHECLVLILHRASYVVFVGLYHCAELIHVNVLCFEGLVYLGLLHLIR